MRLIVPAIVALCSAFFAYLTPPAEGAGRTAGIGSGSTTGGGSTTGNTIVIDSLDEKRSADTYAYNTGTTTWDHLTGRHTAGITLHSVAITASDPHIVTYSHSESVYVEEGTETRVPSGTSMSGATATGSIPVFGGSVSAGNSLYVQTSDTGAIPGGRHLAFWIHLVESVTYDDGRSPTSVNTWGRHEFILQKLPCYEASVTTRKTYGQPNTGGELPADANAPMRFVKYGAWDYKGGAFVGNMPAGGSDASGTARLELFPQGGSTYDQAYEYATLSLFDMGKPGSAGTGAIDVGAYIPTSVGSISESNADQGNQFSITAGAVSLGSTAYDTHPYGDTTLTDGNSNDYVLLKLPTSTSAHPNNSLFGLSLAMVSEADVISANTSCWHYFATKEYQAAQSSFPGTDCSPRIWLIQVYP